MLLTLQKVEEKLIELELATEEDIKEKKESKKDERTKYCSHARKGVNYSV